jgi:5-methylcytosine-specific restriction endonuclease McrA
MKTIEQKILETYVPGKTTLREVARIVGTNHHRVKRVLVDNGVKVIKGKRGAFTKEHRENISRACKGRKTWNKGKKMSKRSLYKNMASHIRFDVSAEWLSKFEDVEKLKFLNACISDRSGRYEETTEWYKEYIEKFYNDPQFNSLYKKWLNSGKDKYMRPTIDHIVPRSKGGTNEIENLQFLSWLENRCKNDMTQDEWDFLKLNMKEYLI